MKKRFMAMMALLAGGTAVVLFSACRCEVFGRKQKSRVEGSRPLRKGEGKLPSEELLDRARKAASEGNKAEGVRLALQGLRDWTRRAGYESARAQRYADLLAKIVSDGGVGPYLESCMQVRDRAAVIACTKVTSRLLHLVGDKGKPSNEAMEIYKAVCLGKQASSVALACSNVPGALAAHPAILPLLRKWLKETCWTRPSDGDLAQMCESAALAGWVAAVGRWDAKLLLETGKVLITQDRPAALSMALRLLTQAGPVPQQAALVVERLLLRAVGSADGLADLDAAFWQRLSAGQRAAVARWAARRLSGKESQIAAVLDLADAKDARALLAKLSKEPALRPLVAKVSPLLGRSMARGEVEAYLTTGKGGRVGRAKTLEYLRAHPSYFEGRILALVATAPHAVRKRMISLIAEIRPQARFGSLSGHVVREGMKSRRCRILLAPARTCDYAPNAKMPVKSWMVGVSVRVMRNKKGVYKLLTASNGGLFVRNVPVGPYRMWVMCTDGKRPRAVWEIEYDRAQKRILSVRCPVVVQPETETQVRAIQVDWTPGLETKPSGPSVTRLVAAVPPGAYDGGGTGRRGRRGRRRR